MKNKEELRIVIGAGEYNNNPGWIHTQEEELNLLKEEQWEEKFLPNSITALLAEHIWEHLTYEQGVEAAKRCLKYLKPGGYIRCGVPDGFFPVEEYQNIVKVGGPGPADHPAASHKVLYNYNLLQQLFEEAGFKVNLLEYCDEGGVFHAEDWDENQGLIFRSFRFDPRNQNGELKCVSLIIDAVKPNG